MDKGNPPARIPFLVKNMIPTTNSGLTFLKLVVIIAMKLAIAIIVSFYIAHGKCPGHACTHGYILYS